MFTLVLLRTAPKATQDQPKFSHCGMASTEHSHQIVIPKI